MLSWIHDRQWARPFPLLCWNLDYVKVALATCFVCVWILFCGDESLVGIFTRSLVVSFAPIYPEYPRMIIWVQGHGWDAL